MNGEPSTPSPRAAISGFDAVAYFDQGEAVPGRPEHEVEHEGQLWLFSTEENARAFRSSPERFVPAYGGRCSFATSLGKVEAGNPRRWQVRDGRLYLNSNAVAHLLWRILPGRREAADQAWGDSGGGAP